MPENDKPSSSKTVNPLNLLLCKDKEVPSPTGAKNKIILFIHNHYDGVGDFMHGVTFANELAFLKEQDYEICAIVCTQMQDPNDQDSAFTKRAKIVRDQLESGNHVFDK